MINQGLVENFKKAMPMLELLSPVKNVEASIFQMVDIDKTVMGVRYQHPVLIYRPTDEMLDYVAVWLSEFQYNTSKTYAVILRRFCTYLATKENPFDPEMLLSFWNYIDVDGIKAWKTYIITKKYRAKKASPIPSTIDREAQIVADFLHWVKNDMGLKTVWDGNLKRVAKAKALHHDMLKGIAGPNEREVVQIDAHVAFAPEDEDYPVEGLARRSQSKAHEYLHDEQIPTVINAFPDPVYKYICFTGYITGLRNFEVLGVPYWRSYLDGTVFDSDPNKIMQRLDEKNLVLKVLGKGDKLRLVKVPAKSWLTIMENWAPLYHERKKMYEAKTGEKLSLSTLWLDKRGNPIYCAYSGLSGRRIRQHPDSVPATSGHLSGS